MRSGKLYTKLENKILRKSDLKRFGSKNINFWFSMEICREHCNNILMQMQASFDDSTSNYSEKHQRYTTTTDRNRTQSRKCSRKTQFLPLLYNCLLPHVVLSALVGSS